MCEKKISFSHFRVRVRWKFRFFSLLVCAYEDFPIETSKSEKRVEVLVQIHCDKDEKIVQFLTVLSFYQNQIENVNLSSTKGNFLDLK